MENSEYNETEMSYELLKKLYEDFINSTVGNVISKVAPKLKNELRELIELLNSRVPRVMLVGRRGSGKSSIVNSFIGKNVLKIGSVTAETSDCEWQNLTFENKEINILDSRGAGEGEKNKNSMHSSPLESIKNAINEKCPDVILFVVKAKEVDANIEYDIKFLSDVKNYIDNNYQNKNIPIIGIVNQVDELDPNFIEPPFNDEEKIDNINKSVNHLMKMFEKYYFQNCPPNVFPICAYMYFNSKTGLLEKDRRWNIDILEEQILKAIPNQAQLKFVKISEIKKIQAELANKIVNIFSSITAVIGTEPIPAADMPILSSLQITMISMIAAISGRPLAISTLKEILSAIGINIGTSFALREVARALIKLWPGYGSIISGTIACGTTKIYGNAAINYFIDNLEINLIRKNVETQINAIEHE